MMLKLIQIHILLGAVWVTCCAPHGFILISEQKIWRDAQSYCREKQLDLATVQSDEDRSMIQEAAGDQNFSSAWIGLYDGLNTWLWSYGKQAFLFKSWRSGEPDVPHTQASCAFITMTGEWGDMACDIQKFFICYQENNLIKPYLYIKISLSWMNALKYCRHYYTDLISIESLFKNLALTTLVVSNGGSEAWIGLSRNMWLWSDGAHVSHLSLRWMDGQPDNLAGTESCAYISEDGAIADDVCTIPRVFFCTQIRKRQWLMLSVKADDNLTKFKVMAAVEDKINHILSMKGMDAGSYVKLRTYSEEIIPDVTAESAEACIEN